MKKQEETKSEYTSLVPAVEQASKILICLAKGPSFRMNLTDICKSVGIHKSKGYSILNTLQKFGFVAKNPEEKRYSLGPGLISLSRKVLDNVNYGDIAGHFLETLARETRSTALFGIINEDNVFVVAKREEAQNIVVTIRLGHRFHITHGAHGKAIVAFLPDKERETILKRKKLFFHGGASKLDRTRLETELAQCREVGFAFDINELNPGINAVAAPVFASQEKLIGSLFIIGTFSKTLIKKYGALVADGAKNFSSMLGADIEQIFKGKQVKTDNNGV